jgi:hypothetical protein
MPTTNQVFARRAGRTVFGMVLLIGAAYLATGAWQGSFSPHRAPRLDAMRIIATTWIAAIAAGLVVRAIAGCLRRPWTSEPQFARSVVVPALGLALLLPITMHLPFVLLVTDASGFDTWVMASLWITGLSHLVFATLCGLRGYQLVAGKPAVSPRKIYVITLITSCLPFVVLWAIPPALVAITALPFLPMLQAMARLVERERLELDTVTQALPRAIAVPPRASA